MLCASSIVSIPPWRIRFFLALRRLLSASFACRRVQTSADKSVSSYAKISIPLANEATIAKIGIGELP